MNYEALTSRHWLLIILVLLFFNVLCYGCILLIYGARLP